MASPYGPIEVDWAPGKVGRNALQLAEVHVWKFPLDVRPEELRVARESLSEEERIRAARFRGEVLQNRFIAGRGWMRHLLAGYLDMPASQISFEVLSHGKPILKVEASSPHPKLAFNLSHSSGCGLLAVGAQDPLGVDLEALDRQVEREGVARRFFSQVEWEAWNRLPTADRIRGFFKVWTGKEAYLKALGVGLSRSLQSFSVRADPRVGAGLVEETEGEGEIESWDMRFLEVAPGYVGTVAAGWRVKSWKLFGVTHLK